MNTQCVIYMEGNESENKSETPQISEREKFLNDFKNQPKVRRDIFLDYEQKNSYELDLPNTLNKLVISLHQKKNDATDYLLKWQIGRSSMFIDAKTAYVVSEAMRYLTEDIVPDHLKPTSDISNGIGDKAIV